MPSLHESTVHGSCQKLTAISPSSDLVAVGTTDDQVAILSFPGLSSVAPAISLESELVDVAWGGEKGEWVRSVSLVCMSVS